MATEPRQTILVTGASGNLAARLMPLLAGYRVIGVDFRAPRASLGEGSTFVSMDFGTEEACIDLAHLLRKEKVEMVVHLAFILDPLGSGILDVDRMWRINVAGTARVVEAIAEANRRDGNVRRFVHVSSVSAYGPDLSRPAREEDKLNAHTLTYAVHKREADKAVQQRAGELGECEVVILRPHIFTGATMENYMVNALRGTAYGKGRLGRRLERQAKRLPLIAPYAQRYLRNKLQFVHVDDVARVIGYVLKRDKMPGPLTILNVAAKGDPLTFQECAQVTGGKILRLPTRTLCRFVVSTLWKLGASSIPPDAFPFLVSSYTMDTSRLRTLLGNDFEKTIHYDNTAALLDSFQREATREAAM
jgi:nucleoside-diphosphate-sugar epimerase